MVPERSPIDERWKRIEALFFAAAELPEDARTSFLDRACGGDADLRAEAESLLANEARSPYDIAAVIEAAATALFDENAMRGVRFGAYRIEREIGRGGMGAVYLASRADEEFKKRVAIKLIKRGVDTDAVLKRFLQERQVLAGLDHPNIARLLDGGTSSDGRPWFALEYIEGKPIQAYCVEKGLSVAERCELFRRVCEPVSYAHRNLVIHRDLKPANILVTPDGEPKLLDFGIARLLTVDPGENTVEITGMTSSTNDSVKPLTPAYASPEQIRGEPVNTTADVFSLGSVFFEILTGLPPVRPPDRNRSRPTPALDRDLDNIVQMATRAEAARRYQSVEQFSEDVRRYLAGLPVLARDDTWRYRAGKFLLRNRLSVAAATAFLTLVAGGVVSVLWQARQTGIQRQHAEQRLDQLVELANRTLLNAHGSAERLPGGTEARREVTRTTLEYLDKLNTENGNDKRVLSALASAYTRLARIEGDPQQPNLGDLRGSERSYREGGRILRTLLAADPDNSALQLRVAEATTGLGNVLAATGHPTEAIEQYREGLNVTGLALARDPANLSARKTSATLHLATDAVALLLDGSATRKDILEQIAANTLLLAEYPNDTDCLLNLAQNYSQLGIIAGRLGQTQESLANHRKSVGWREQALALHPHDALAQRELMMAYGHIGDMLGSPFLWSLGDSRGAREYYGKAAQIAQAMVLADSSDKQARLDLGIVLMRLGTVLDSPGEAAESLATLNKSAGILEPLLDSGTRNFGYTTQLAILFEYKAQRLNRLGDYAGALHSYRRSLDICVKLLPIRPDNLNVLRQKLIDEGAIAQLLARAGDRAGSVGLARETLAQSEQFAAVHGGTDRVYAPRASDWCGAVYETLAQAREGAREQQISDLRRAAGYYRRALGQWGRLDANTAGHFSAEIRTTRAKLARCEEASAK